MSELRAWARQNATLLYFLIAQAFGIGAAVFSLTVYMTTMEGRVSILENRGAPYTVDRLTRIDEKLTIMEQRATQNTASIERIIDVLTKELGKNPSGK